jgi:nucleotide-binding universal stress UspA family protein
MPPELLARARQSAQSSLETMADAARRGVPADAPWTVETAVTRGAAPSGLVREAQAFEAELVVLGRHGHAPVRDLFLGSIAEAVVRRGSSPVLVVKRPAEAPYRTVIVAVDADQVSLRAVLFAARVAPGARLLLAHAYNAPFDYALYPGVMAEGRGAYRAEFRDAAERSLAPLHEQLRSRELPFRQLYQEGDARDGVLALARKHEAELLVLGTHARSGLSYALLGSVAAGILREAEADVLVVRPRSVKLAPA